VTSSDRPRDPQGKAALFSGQQRHDGRFIIECSGCGSHTRVGTTRLVGLALPINFTNPFRYHHTWLKCPACDERRWVRIKVFG